MIFVISGLENALNCHCNKKRNSVIKDQLTLKVRALLCVLHISENYYENWVETKGPLLCVKRIWFGCKPTGLCHIEVLLHMLRSPHHTLLLKLEVFPSQPTLYPLASV